MKTILSTLLVLLLAICIPQMTLADQKSLQTTDDELSDLHLSFLRVEANTFFNATGIYASPGESFLIIAAGVVDLSTLNGGYRTTPDGTIVMTPPSASGAFEFFRDRAGPFDTDPVKGSRKSFLPLRSDIPGHLPGAPYGALVVGFSPTSSPSSFADFPNGFALIGTHGIAQAPNTGGYLFFGVNDFNNPGGDNAGTFQVSLFPLRSRP